MQWYEINSCWLFISKYWLQLIYIYIYSIMEVWHNGGPCYERVKKMYLQLLTSSQQLKSPVDQGTGDSGWDFKSGLAAGLGGGFDWFVIWTGTPVAVQW